MPTNDTLNELFLEVALRACARDCVGVGEPPLAFTGTCVRNFWATPVNQAKYDKDKKPQIKALWDRVACWLAAAGAIGGAAAECGAELALGNGTLGTCSSQDL